MLIPLDLLDGYCQNSIIQVMPLLQYFKFTNIIIKVVSSPVKQFKEIDIHVLILFVLQLLFSTVRE